MIRIKTIHKQIKDEITQSRENYHKLQDKITKLEKEISELERLELSLD